MPAMMADVEEIEVVVAHNERATLRVGDVFLKIDADQPHRCRGRGDGGGAGPDPGDPVAEAARASSSAWAAAGAVARTLHVALLPPWPGRSVDELASHLADECEWLVANDILPVDVVTRNRRLAETALRPWTPLFIHGDLQVDQVFVAGYGTDVDRDLIRAWWSLRCLLGVRWLVEHGFGPPEQMPEVAVLRSRP